MSVVLHVPPAARLLFASVLACWGGASYVVSLSRRSVAAPVVLLVLPCSYV